MVMTPVRPRVRRADGPGATLQRPLPEPREGYSELPKASVPFRARGTVRCFARYKDGFTSRFAVSGKHLRDAHWRRIRLSITSLVAERLDLEAADGHIPPF